ncbi:MAG TPA: holo-ACP synthase [Clostridiaceae bacterium]|nr:holo-ACP synthase [Clostridiaceae bacterium]
MSGTVLRSGVDLIRIKRVKDAVERRGETFIYRIFTEIEAQDCRTATGKWRWPSLAGRFAAKEAVAKALGTGLLGEAGVGLHDIEIQRLGTGQPQVILHSKAHARYVRLQGDSISISLAHEGEYAIAYCTILCHVPVADESDLCETEVSDSHCQ